MKNRSRVFVPLTVTAALAVLSSSAQADTVVYANDQNFSIRFNPGVFEVGDEVTLAGTDRWLTYFEFSYYGIGGSGNEQAAVRIYANDRPSNGRMAPGTVLWDSGFFSISPTPADQLVPLSWNTTPGTSLYDPSQPTPLSAVVPDSFTWSVQFTGTADIGESYGVALFSPPSIGENWTDYWERSGPGGSWLLNTNPPYSMDFGARFEAVPEPSVPMLGLLGVAGLLGLAWRRRLKA